MAIEIKSPLTGRIVPLSEVPDATFAAEILGKGVAVIPEERLVVSPVSGVVDMVADSKHAISIVADSGAEVLVHVGLDTVSLKGTGFAPRVQEGDRVEAGDPLLDFDPETIAAARLQSVSPVIICNTDAYAKITATEASTVVRGDILLHLS